MCMYIDSACARYPMLPRGGSNPDIIKVVVAGVVTAKLCFAYTFDNNNVVSVVMLAGK